MTPRLRLATWCAAAATLLGGQALWLVLLRGPRIFDDDFVLIGGQFLLILPVLLIALLLTTTPADAIKLRRRTSEWIILVGAALLQLLAVALLRPGLSEDVLRYRVDGRMWLHGVSPYATAPRDWPGRDAIDTLVPFPHARTIYPAVSELSFVAAAIIERTARQAVCEFRPAAPAQHSPWRHYLRTEPAPYRATVFRALFAAAAVGMTLILLRLLGVLDQSPWWAVVVAWNPLVTLEFGGMGHQDVIGVLFILLALYALARRRPTVSALSLALAAAVKPFAFLLVPFAAREAPARVARLPGAFTLALLVLYVPPLLYQDGHAGWRESARRYSGTWEANGSLYELIVRSFGDGDKGRARERAKQMARLIGVSAMLATALAAWQFRARPAMAGYWLCLVALLVSPVVYPWYLLWPLCFVPLLGGRAGWTVLVWSGTVAVSYALWKQPAWRLTNAQMALEYGIVYATLLAEIGWMACHARREFARGDAAQATAG